MTNHRREKPQPPVFTEANLKMLALMDEFRDDMRVIEGTKQDLESALQPSAFNPLQFKYIHYEFLFKVWLAGHSRGVNHETQSRSQTSAPGDSAETGSNSSLQHGAGQ